MTQHTLVAVNAAMLTPSQVTILHRLAGGGDVHVLHTRLAIVQSTTPASVEDMSALRDMGAVCPANKITKAGEVMLKIACACALLTKDL